MESIERGVNINFFAIFRLRVYCVLKYDSDEFKAINSDEK